jgi:fumarate reductase flavoprotein subunit
MAVTSEIVEVDVLVVGAGACGLIAAIKAAQQGASVAVLEKLDRFAGNTMLSCGSIPAAGTRKQREAGIVDSVETMIADMERVSGPHEASHLTRALVERSAEVVDWLVDYCGIEVKLYTNYKHVGHTIPRLHTQPTGRGADLIGGLARAAERNGIDILFNNPVTRLIADDSGAVIGAEAQSGATRYRIDAKKVILASNGYGANRALLREFCPEIADAAYFGATGSEGEAIEWGRALGAKLGNIGAYQAHASVSYPQGELLTWSAAEKGAFYVNKQGKRFGNENIGYSGFGALVMAQGNEAYAIYDARIRDYVAHYQETYRALVEMGGAREAATIEELARIHGIDAANLAATVEQFNRAARKEAADPFGRKEFGMAPVEAPFVVTRVGAAMFHTQGGLLVDKQGRVLRDGGKPIPNLFAGGGAAAGVSGKSGGGGYVSGNGLLAATVLGYIAGETAGAELLRHTSLAAS